MTDALSCLGCATQRYSCEHDAETEIARAIAELAESAERLARLVNLYQPPDEETILAHNILTDLGDYTHSRRKQ